MSAVQRGLLVVAVAFVAFIAFKPAGSAAAEGEGRALVKQGALLLDVRTPEEFASGHVAGAVNLPVQELDAKWAALKIPPERPVVVYCRSGRRSAAAKQWLEAHGMKKVVDVGPMPDWK